MAPSLCTEVGRSTVGPIYGLGDGGVTSYIFSMLSLFD